MVLKGVPALPSPEPLYALVRMGHGDEIGERGGRRASGGEGGLSSGLWAAQVLQLCSYPHQFLNNPPVTQEISVPGPSGFSLQPPAPRSEPGPPAPSHTPLGVFLQMGKLRPGTVLAGWAAVPGPGQVFSLDSALESHHS